MARKGPIEKALDEGHRETLEAVRRSLAAKLDGELPPAYVAGITRRLLDVESELHALATAEEEVAHGMTVEEAARVPDEPLFFD